MTGLVDRLVALAEQTIRAEAPGLEYDTARIRGLTLEFEVGTGSIVKASRLYIERLPGRPRAPSHIG